MLKKFMPSDFVKSVLKITPEYLKKYGIKAIITDLDNTLVEWDRPSATPELTDWFQQMKNQRIQIVIVSNNNEKRVSAFAEPLGIPFISRAKKPSVKAFYRAMKMLEAKNEETVVIGDQLLTDIFGGNIIGLKTILVVPVANNDSWKTKLNRGIERMILKYFKKKGLLHWGESTDGN